jgi:hypothetical protein
MKITFQTLAIITLFFLNIDLSICQENPISKKYKEQSIQKLSHLINDFYVSPEIANLTVKHLELLLKEGHFKQFKNDITFAAALTKSVQEINNDKHMRISANKPYKEPKNSSEGRAEEILGYLEWSRTYNAGFNTVKVLEGNVGYLDLRGFAGLDKGKPMADAYMKLISNCDAIIVDLSQNGGGEPSMVQYLCSYFFDQKILLNSLYWREGARTQEFWTIDSVGGVKMPDVPLFVITSNGTFSGAEEFSYNMQTQKRATLVGQTTGGGANPGSRKMINENLNVFIPLGKAINPITKTNWEGVGVIPEVKTSIEESFNKAHELAKKSAETYRNELKEEHRLILLNLINELNLFATKKSEEVIQQILNECEREGLLGEGDINMLGYDYLYQPKTVELAEVIFKINTIIYPNSANAFDSYAEALMMKGDLDSALLNSKISVEIATENDDQELFKSNLERIKQKLKDEL